MKNIVGIHHIVIGLYSPRGVDSLSRCGISPYWGVEVKSDILYSPSNPMPSEWIFPQEWS